MSSPDTNARANSSITDSPWFWLFLFSATAWSAASSIAPKHAERQGRIVRMQDARDLARLRAEAASQAEDALKRGTLPQGSMPADESEMPSYEAYASQRAVATLPWLRLFFALLSVVAVILLTRDRLRVLRQRRLAAVPPTIEHQG
jgi:hypothetical protein